VALFGRDSDLTKLRERVQGARLVTLVGAGGIGKTELARAFAAAEGWRFVDLTEAREPLGVMTAAAREYDVVLEGDTEEAVARLFERLAGARLVLDNFEALVDTADETVGRLLHEQPDVKLLITSRVPLNMKEEALFELGPLDAEAARVLFVERARGRRGAFEEEDLSDEDAGALFDITGGLPLAIELCAARVGVLSVGDIIERARAGLAIYADPGSDRPDRQRTLAASIEATWELLSDDARRALLDAVAFRGGLRPVDAEHVIEGVEDVLAALDEAVRAGMLVRDVGEDVRLRFLAPIRAFVEDKGGPSEDARARHRARFAGIGFEWAILAEHLDGPRGLNLLERERENLVAASEGDDAHAARAAICLHPLLRARGPRRMHLRVARRALELAESIGDRELLLGAAFVRAQAEQLAGNFADVPRVLAGIEPVGRPTEDDDERAVYWYVRAQVELARSLSHLRDLAGADAALDEAEAALRDDTRSGQFPPLVNVVRVERGSVLVVKGELLDAEALLERVFHDASEAGDVGTALHSASMLMTLQAWRGDYPRALVAYERARACAEALGERATRVDVEIAAAEIALAQREYGEAARRIEAARALAETSGVTTVDSRARGVLGLTLLIRGDLEPAARELERSADAFASHPGSEPYGGFMRGFLAVAYARAGLTRRAEATLAKAKEEAGPFDPWGLRALIEGALPAAQSRIARDAGDEARADELLKGARAAVEAWEPDDSRRSTRTFVDVTTRLAQQLLAAADPDGVLQVVDDAERVQLLGHEEIDLSQREPVRRVLARLVDEHRDQPGRWVSTEDLFRAGWSGEKAMERAARNRVQQAVSTLRKLGLRDVIDAERGRYRLKADLLVERPA
jgi:predicted ATPase